MKQEIIASFEDAYKATGDYLQSAIKGKEMPGIEWAVLGLARAEREADFDKEVYYQNLVKALKENGSAKLSNTKSTENSRTVLALTAIGKDVKTSPDIICWSRWQTLIICRNGNQRFHSL
ncbi:MAG: hypothetical protein ACLSFO_03420 [Anaerovoracaceae bacterium]